MTTSINQQDRFESKCMNGIWNAQQGFTLVELMIGMIVGLVLLLVIGTVFVSSQGVFREQEDNARVQENGRFALEVIGRSIKQAGHVEMPFTGFKVEFTGTAISGTNGGAGVADTLTVQFEGAIGDSDCDGKGVTVAGTIIQNHFNIDAANAELRCGSPIFVFIPRRPKITFRFPSEAKYSAAFKDSSKVIPKPRLINTGKAC